MITVVKIGGNVIDSPELLADFLDKFSKIDGPKVLVHGGGKIATELSKKLGVEPNMVDGRRITDADTIDIVTMVYAGLVNKKMVAALQSRGCNAIGLSGADANIICGVVRPKEPIDFGFVADLTDDSVHEDHLKQLLYDGLTPVFSAIVHDGNGNLLNCNADTIASSIAVALSKKGDTKLVYCFEKRGVLRDVDDDASLISLIKKEEMDGLVSSGVVAKGMIPKLTNAFAALSKGVGSVVITQAEDVLTAAAKPLGCGTTLSL
jgi:acetylglutamate kinase